MSAKDLLSKSLPLIEKSVIFANAETEENLENPEEALKMQEAIKREREMNDISTDFIGDHEFVGEVVSPQSIAKSCAEHLKYYMTTSSSQPAESEEGQSPQEDKTCCTHGLVDPICITRSFTSYPDFRTHFKAISKEAFQRMFDDLGSSLVYSTYDQVFCQACIDQYIHLVQTVEDQQADLQLISDQLSPFTHKRPRTGPTGTKDRMEEAPTNFIVANSFLIRLKNVLRCRKRLLQNPHKITPDQYKMCVEELHPTKSLLCVGLFSSFHSGTQSNQVLSS